MFCPECKAEYGPGFTRCSHCDVALVDRLTVALDVGESEQVVHHSGPSTEPVPLRNQLESAEGMICKVYQREQYRGFWRRCWANLIDGFILSVAFGIANAISPDISSWFALLAVPLYQIGYHQPNSRKADFCLLLTNDLRSGIYLDRVRSEEASLARQDCWHLCRPC